MRSLRRAILIVIALLAFAARSTYAEQPASDVTVTGVGTDTAGTPAMITCDLAFVAVPSNLVTGRCAVTVGVDQLTITGLRGTPEQALSVVLNGRVTVRGLAESASGRFGPLTTAGTSRFPIALHVDPLGHGWAVHSEAPGRAGQPIAAGTLTQGSITFAIP